MDNALHEVVVVGAGPAGLAVAASLRRQGLSSLVIDKAEAVGSTWRSHYDRLHLHTERALSGLPGLPIPAAYGKWVPREKVVAYLEDYARHHGVQVRLGTPVERIDKSDGGFVLKSDQGPLRARAAVIATGYNHTAQLPEWPGRETFAGELIHSARYKNAAAYRGRDVLVVGTGNSGAEIAVDLVEGSASRVRIAVRTPPNLVRREVLGISTQRLGVLLRHMPPRLIDGVAGLVQRLTVGDLTKHGLPKSPRGIYTRAREGQIPILDVGLIDLVKQKKVTFVGGVTGFEGRDVLLADGQRIQPDAVIAATGFQRGLERLVGHLGVLDERGLPRVHGPKTDPAAPGLHFIGYSNPISGNLREIGLDAQRIARALRRSGRI